MARKSVMSAGQVNEDRLEDADGDTLVQVEESTDEDKIRFDTNGVQRMIIQNNGVGIGAANPTRPLVVLDTSGPQIRLAYTAGSKYVDLQATAAGDLEITPSNANGHTKFISDENASIVIQSANIGDSDAILSFSVDGGSSIPWSIGVDDSDADKLKFGTATPDTNSRLTIDSNGAVGVGTTTPNSTLDVNGSRSTRIDSVTGNVTIDHTHHTVLMGNSNTATTCTLPSVSSGISGRVYTFKKIGSDATNCEVHAAAGEDIDEDQDAEYILAKQFDAVSVQCDGAAWWIIGEIHNP